ncbi:MAG: hypothetical protein NTW61_00010 [Candidatus Melainabacteria bacterium]|nr:hypothetical protein [Candidatus Melainabacteria bacterium]
METVRLSNHGIYNSNSLYSPQPSVGYGPALPTSPNLSTNIPASKPDSFNSAEADWQNKKSSVTTKKRKQTASAVASKQPQESDKNVAILGGLTLLITAGLGIYFAGKHFNWWKKGEIASPVKVSQAESELKSQPIKPPQAKNEELKPKTTEPPQAKEKSTHQTTEQPQAEDPLAKEPKAHLQALLHIEKEKLAKRQDISEEVKQEVDEWLQSLVDEVEKPYNKDLVVNLVTKMMER